MKLTAHLVFALALLTSSLAIASGPTGAGYLFPYASSSSDGYLAAPDWNTFNAKASASAPSFSGNVTFQNGHLISTQTIEPVAAVQSAAGTSASCSVVHATDVAGQILLTTGSGSVSTGAYCSVAFHTAYGITPICRLNNAGANALSSVYVSSSTSAVVLNAGVAGPTGTSFTYNYDCLQTQNP